MNSKPASTNGKSPDFDSGNPCSTHGAGAMVKAALRKAVRIADKHAKEAKSGMSANSVDIRNLRHKNYRSGENHSIFQHRVRMHGYWLDKYQTAIAIADEIRAMTKNVKGVSKK